MLAPMDIPWLVLGVGLVLLAGLVAALVLRRSPGRRTDPSPAGFQDDDLPGFRDSPPGSAAEPDRSGWATLTTPPAPADPPARPRRDTLVVVGVMGGTALLLLGAAAVVAAATGTGTGEPPRHAATTADPARTEARLTFGGVVLEPRAVGVTVTYPVVQLSVDDERSRARVELPTYNCLTAEAPADPVAAGCTPSVPEYAELASPALAVDEEGDRLVVSGRFPTETRPNGSAPAATGRAYELRITVTPAGRASGDGWRPAEGVLELGSGSTETVDGVSVLRAGS